MSRPAATVSKYHWSTTYLLWRLDVSLLSGVAVLLLTGFVFWSCFCMILSAVLARIS
jgi:hypothetical protein